MLRNSTWDVNETNLALVGSKLDVEHRKEEGALETAWNYNDSPIGNETGLWIWRVEAFKLKALSPAHHGEFFVGDSYLVLNTSRRPGSDKLIHHVHFWLGRETTQDEAGTAAYKAVELDDYLNGLAMQHREIQGAESDAFRSYFKKLVYRLGGFHSGFHHVVAETQPTRLLRVHRPLRLARPHTQNHVVISEVPLSYKSLASGDVFILDTADVVYQWQGSDSNPIERAKASEFIAQLLSERNGKGEVVVVEQASGSARSFWEALGSEGPVQQGEMPDDVDGQGHEDGQEDAKNDKVLLRIVVNEQPPTFEQVARSSVTQSMLDTHHVYIFDVGHQVFTWIGRAAPAEERRCGLEYAQAYVKQHHRRAAFTPICQVMEGAEDELFDASMDGWQGW